MDESGSPSAPDQSNLSSTSRPSDSANHLSSHIADVAASVKKEFNSNASTSNLPTFHDLLNSVLDDRRRQLRGLTRHQAGSDANNVTKGANQVDNDDAKNIPLPSLSYLEYRKALKKAKRKMKRRIAAVTVAKEEREKRRKSAEEGEEDEEEERDGEEGQEDGVNEQDELDEIERRLRDHEAWLEREKRAKEAFDLKKRKEEEDEKRRLEEEEGEAARKEAEASRQFRINEAAIEAARATAAAKPPPPTDLSDPNNCDFYMRTGACRYGEVCKRLHPEIEVGTKVIIPHMFDSPALQAIFSKPEGDVTLENPDEELLKSFREFYEDTLPEFRKIGDVKMFKVCSNRVKHLRGNVYVEYEREEEAFVAAQVFGGRWYAGKQLTARVTVVRNWRQATCLQYLQNCCPKGIRCNYLHCFVNPDDEFEGKVDDVDGEDAESKKRLTEGRESKDQRESNGGSSARDKDNPSSSSWRRQLHDGRPPPKWKRSPSPPGKHRPFRSRDHYVNDERIWKKDKDGRNGDGDGKPKKDGDVKKVNEKNTLYDSEDEVDLNDRSRYRDQRHHYRHSHHRHRKEDRRSSRSRSRSRDKSGSSGGRSDSDAGDGGRSSSGSSSDEMGKKILKATLKSIKSGKKSKKKSKKSSKKKSKKSKKKKKSQSREPGDSTDSSWDSDASD